MKFVSNSSLYRLILRPGLPEERASGRLAVPTVFVRFEEGMADVNDEEKIQLMLAHPAFKVDFFPYDNTDPHVQKLMAGRVSAEPEHNVMDIQYGHVGKVINPGKQQVSPEMKALLVETAMDMAKKMAAEIVQQQMAPIQQLLEKLAEKQDKAAKNPGRPPANKKTGDLAAGE